jgi:hypothetical protein
VVYEALSAVIDQITLSMDLQKELIKAHNKQQAEKITRFIGSDPARFACLIKIYLQGPYRITQRASWPIGKCIEKDPALVGPHLKPLLDFLKKPGVHDAVKRNTMRLLQYIDIPKRNQDQVMTICFEYLQEPKLAVAIKVFSMTALMKIIHDKPELLQELRVIIEDEFPYATAAYRSRGLKVLKQIQSLS